MGKYTAHIQFGTIIAAQQKKIKLKLLSLFRHTFVYHFFSLDNDADVDRDFDIGHNLETPRKRSVTLPA